MPEELDPALETVCVVLGSERMDNGFAGPFRGGVRVTHIAWDEFQSLVTTDLRSLRARVAGRQLVLYLASRSARPLFAHCCVIAALLGPARIVVFEHGRPLRVVTRWCVVAALAQIVWATLCALGALAWFFLRVRRRAGELAAAVPAPVGGVGIYLKTPYSFSGGVVGGSVAHTAGVVNALCRLGVRTVFMSAEPPGDLDGRVCVEHVERPPTAPALASWYGLLLGQRLSARSLEVAKKSGRARFVYQRLVPYNAAGLEVARRLRIPWVVEYNGSEAWIAERWGRGGVILGLLAAFERAVLRGADRVVVVSEVLKDELLQLGIPEERIRMYPNSVDPGYYSPGRVDDCARDAVRAGLGIEPHALLCTFVGTFGRWHGPEVLAQAISEWHSEDAASLQRYNVVFLFVGDGQMMPEVRRRLGVLVDSEFVRFAGTIPQRDVVRYLAASDILLSPHVANADGSRFFGSPTKLFEYMAMAKAIVSSDLEQIHEVLWPSLYAAGLPPSGDPPRADDQNVAILCRPGVPADIRSAIMFLAARPAWREALGRKARERVLARYTWEHHVRAVLGDLIS